MSEAAVGSTRISVERVIHASAADIYALVTDPAGHVRIDGSGMLVEAPDARPVTAVGDTFTIEMDREPLGVALLIPRIDRAVIEEHLVGEPEHAELGMVAGGTLIGDKSE